MLPPYVPPNWVADSMMMAQRGSILYVMTASNATVIVVETPGKAPPRMPTATPIVIRNNPYGVDRSQKAFAKPASICVQSIQIISLDRPYRICSMNNLLKMRYRHIVIPIDTGRKNHRRHL